MNKVLKLFLKSQLFWLRLDDLTCMVESIFVPFFCNIFQQQLLVFIQIESSRVEVSALEAKLQEVTATVTRLEDEKRR